MADPALSAHEHREDAERAAREHDPFISRVSITVAILAVLAATVGSLETVEASGAITASSQSVLAQEKATDAWNEYQADSVKKHIFDVAADLGGPNTARYRISAAEQQARQAQIKRHAVEAQQQRDRLSDESRSHEHRHHRLTLAATLIEIGIAVCTVAIITRRRTFWLGSVGLGGVGVVLLGLSYVA